LGAYQSNQIINAISESKIAKASLKNQTNFQADNKTQSSKININSVGCQTDDLKKTELNGSPDLPVLENGVSVITFAEKRKRRFEMEEESNKKRFVSVAQSEKFQKRVTSGKEMIQQIIAYIIDSQYQFELLFNELLETDQNVPIVD